MAWSAFGALLAIIAGSAPVALVVAELLPARGALGRRDPPGAAVDRLARRRVAMAGSLYFSESANFVPCKLCWFQRIAMYPLAWCC